MGEVDAGTRSEKVASADELLRVRDVQRVLDVPEDYGVQARERWGYRLGKGRKACAREALGAGRLHSGQVREG